MGQKTHPLGFRLGITQEHKSMWCFNFKKYDEALKEDDIIRTYLNNISKTNGISNVKIKRNGKNSQIEVTIETGKPSFLIGDSGSNVKQLIKDFKRLLSEKYEIIINVIEVKNIEEALEYFKH